LLAKEGIVEIKRIENFESGDTNCIKCGKVLHLWFNGGELDSVECCGLQYKTEAQQIDLVVYDNASNTASTGQEPADLQAQVDALGEQLAKNHARLSGSCR
jgi:hypothetical protein